MSASADPIDTQISAHSINATSQRESRRVSNASHRDSISSQSSINDFFSNDDMQERRVSMSALNALEHANQKEHEHEVEVHDDENMSTTRAKRGSVGDVRLTEEGKKSSFCVIS